MARFNFDDDRRTFDQAANAFLKGKISRRGFLTKVGALGTALAFSSSVSAILSACAPVVPAAAPVRTPTAPAPDEKWPISNMTTQELLNFYDNVLPFSDQLPLEAGPDWGQADHHWFFPNWLSITPGEWR